MHLKGLPEKRIIKSKKELTIEKKESNLHFEQRSNNVLEPSHRHLFFFIMLACQKLGCFVKFDKNLLQIQSFWIAFVEYHT